MSHLNYLEKLLEGVGTEWQALGDLVTLRRGRVMSKGFLSENTGIFPVYSSQTANDGMIGSIDTYDFDGEYISWTTDGANAGTIFYRKGKFSITNVCGLMKIIDENLLNYKYLYYWLTTEAKKYVYSGMGNPKLMSHQVEKIAVPIPCPDNPEKSLAIQVEIVRILDAFTAMTAELTAELNMRKKQYNYYRDQLLSFEEGDVEWKALGEIGHIVTGRTPKSSDKSAWGNDVDFVTPSDIKNGMRNIAFPSRRLSAEGAASMSKVLLPSGSLLVTCIGADMGKTVINANDCIPNQQINAITLTDDSVQVGYLFHVLTAMREALRRQGELGGGTMPLINKSDFSKIVVPIPSHEEQARIVAILDKFDTLTNSISEGLPREIELRQKQSEYYRDLLLSFPKQEEEAA